jgi:hypothetical protein
MLVVRLCYVSKCIPFLLLIVIILEFRATREGIFIFGELVAPIIFTA